MKYKSIQQITEFPVYKEVYDRLFKGETIKVTHDLFPALKEIAKDFAFEHPEVKGWKIQIV